MGRESPAAAGGGWEYREGLRGSGPSMSSKRSQSKDSVFSWGGRDVPAPRRLSVRWRGAQVSPVQVPEVP